MWPGCPGVGLLRGEDVDVDPPTSDLNQTEPSVRSSSITITSPGLIPWRWQDRAQHAHVTERRPRPLIVLGPPGEQQVVKTVTARLRPSGKVALVLVGERGHARAQDATGQRTRPERLGPLTGRHPERPGPEPDDARRELDILRVGFERVGMRALGDQVQREIPIHLGRRRHLGRPFEDPDRRGGRRRLARRPRHGRNRDIYRVDARGRCRGASGTCHPAVSCVCAGRPAGRTVRAALRPARWLLTGEAVRPCP